MEEVIRKELCNFCMNNKCSDCMEIEQKEKNNVKSYKCINYKDSKRREPFYEFDYIIKSNNNKMKNRKKENLK